MLNEFEKSTVRNDLEVVAEREKNIENEMLFKKFEGLENHSDRLELSLKLIDKKIFPENPLPIKIVEKIEKNNQTFVASHHFDESESEKEIIKNECYEVSKEIDEKNYKNLATIIGIAIHEVRHRVQHTLPIELFTKENIKEFEQKYPFLKSIQKEKEKSLSELIMEKFSKDLSPNDFDAVLVERLSLYLLKNKIPLSEILSILLKNDAEEIIKNIEHIVQENNLITKNHDSKPNPKN